MSIATKRGDGGQTGLAGGIRVSKSNVRVEAYGTVDELNAAMGLARALCQDEDLRTRTAAIQRELFRVGSALATPAESAKAQVPVTPELVDALTEQVHQIESVEGVLSDWSVSGEHAAAAAYDVARTVCRRAERNVVRLDSERSRMAVSLQSRGNGADKAQEADRDINVHKNLAPLFAGADGEKAADA